VWAGRSAGECVTIHVVTEVAVGQLWEAWHTKGPGHGSRFRIEAVTDTDAVVEYESRPFGPPTGRGRIPLHILADPPRAGGGRPVYSLVEDSLAISEPVEIVE
jgi:hypothetical protein